MVNPNKHHGYHGKLLRVDLTENRGTTEILEEETLKKYLGGTCLGTKILYEEVAPEVKYNDPQNRLIFASGPLGGTRVGGSGTYSVVTVGALTNGASASQANGFFGAYLRFSGFDGLVVQGVSKDWVYLYLHDGRVEFKKADHLLGLDIFQTEDAIKEELNQPERGISVACIGPAGENQVRFSIVANDKGHIVAHNGIGAVMGSKKIKAIAVSRKGRGPEVKDSEAFNQAAKELLEYSKKHGYSGLHVHKYGTLEGISMMNKREALPVKNYLTNHWGASEAEAEKWGAKYMRTQYAGKKSACWACQFDHCFKMKITEGPYAGSEVEEPEYESLASCGPIIGNKDVTAALILSDEIDRMGIDVNETGWVLAFVMECYEKGLLTLEQLDGVEMTWGNVEGARALIAKIARREAIGDMLAEGVMRAARSIGGEATDFAVHTLKGNTPRSHDHRIIWNELLDTCVSNCGTIESGIQMPLEMIGAKLPANYFGFGLPDEVSTLVAKSKGAHQFDDSLGLCRFNSLSHLELLCQAVNAATGWDLGIEEAMAIGRRSVHLTRMFNIRRGIAGPDMDRPSPRYGSTPKEGFAKGISSREVWDRMLENYYELMGWDKKTGIPLPRTLEALGLGHVLADLP